MLASFRFFFAYRHNVLENICSKQCARCGKKKNQKSADFKISLQLSCDAKLISDKLIIYKRAVTYVSAPSRPY